MNQEEVLNLIRDTAKSIDYDRVYYTLRKLRVKWLKPRTVEIMRLCLAIDKLGFTITTNLLNHLMGLQGRGKKNRTIQLLHTMGDKHLLVYVRENTPVYRWKVSPLVTRQFEDFVI